MRHFVEIQQKFLTAGHLVYLRPSLAAEHTAASFFVVVMHPPRFGGRKNEISRQLVIKHGCSNRLA